MDKFMLPEETPQNRLRYLEDSADGKVEETYFKKLDADELIQRRAEFTANALKMDDIETEKKEAMDEFKERLNPLKDTHKRLSSEIRTGYVECEGTLYKFIDEDTRMVYFYDVNGELIPNKTRPADSDELQNTIHMEIRKNGTK